MGAARINGSFDLVLVGGGLANGLLAYRLRQIRPDLSVLVLESDERPGGNHTWSFHASDLDAEQNAWLAPFVVHRWPGYDVAFPGFARRLATPYRAVTSERFADLLVPTLGDSLRCAKTAAIVEPQRVVLSNGDEIGAGAVIDGRGFQPSNHLALAYQKFLGLEIRLTGPHGLDHPMLMDARVEQTDGYRFVYVLPLAPDRLLVEDTYYADDPALDAAGLRRRIESYLADRGWRVHDILRQEAGVLPITLDGDIEAFWRDGDPGLARSGLRAGLFHPTTGYSLPDAVRLADHVAGLRDLRTEALSGAIRDWSVRRWREGAFFRLLNRMLFRAGSSAERFRVLRRFYGLPEPTIRRFYAGRLSTGDKVRLLAGKPPVPVLGAVRAAFGAGPMHVRPPQR